MESQEYKGIKLSEGIILTALPILGYLFAFVFEFGYANTFHIPYKLFR